MSFQKRLVDSFRACILRFVSASRESRAAFSLVSQPEFRRKFE